MLILSLSLGLGLTFQQSLVSAPRMCCKTMMLLLYNLAQELQGHCIYRIAAMHVIHTLLLPLILQKAQSSVNMYSCLPCRPDQGMTYKLRFTCKYDTESQICRFSTLYC